MILIIIIVFERTPKICHSNSLKIAMMKVTHLCLKIQMYFTEVKGLLDAQATHSISILTGNSVYQKNYFGLI